MTYSMIPPGFDFSKGDISTKLFCRGALVMNTGEAPAGGPVLAACPTAKTELLLLVIIRHLHLRPSRSSVSYWGGPFLRARFFVRFEDQNKDLLCHIVFSNFHSLEALEACLEACPEVFCSNFHVSRRWSSRLALRPASNYTSSSKLFVWLQFPYP